MNKYLCKVVPLPHRSITGVLPDQKRIDEVMELHLTKRDIITCMKEGNVYLIVEIDGVRYEKHIDNISIIDDKDYRVWLTPPFNKIHPNKRLDSVEFKRIEEKIEIPPPPNINVPISDNRDIKTLLEDPISSTEKIIMEGIIHNEIDKANSEISENDEEEVGEKVQETVLRDSIEEEVKEDPKVLKQKEKDEIFSKLNKQFGAPVEETKSALQMTDEDLRNMANNIKNSGYQKPNYPKPKSKR